MRVSRMMFLSHNELDRLESNEIHSLLKTDYCPGANEKRRICKALVEIIIEEWKTKTKKNL